VKEYFEKWAKKKVWWDWDNYSGIFLLFLIIIEIITGFSLSFYYEASPEGSNESLRYIMNSLPYGWLIRSIHYWAGHLIFIFLSIHIFLKILKKKFVKEYVVEWSTGVGLLILSVLWFMSGRYITWSQNSFWEITTLSEELNELPILGKYIRLFIRGGESVGSQTLTRSYVFHILFLGILFSTIAFFHFKSIINRHTDTSEVSKKSFALYLIDALIIMFFLFSLLLVFSVFLPVELPPPADPYAVPEKIDVFWFIYPLYKFYTLIPKHIFFIHRVLIFSIACSIILLSFSALPFIYDEKKKYLANFLHIFFLFFIILYSGLSLLRVFL